MVEHCHRQTRQHRAWISPYLWHQTHFNPSRNFQLSRLPWVSHIISHGICFSVISILFDPLLPLSAHFRSHHSSLLITSSSPEFHILCLLTFLSLPILSWPLSVSVLVMRIYRPCFQPLLPPPSLPQWAVEARGLRAAVNPAAFSCLTPAPSLAGQPEVTHTESRKRKQTPDVAITESVPKSRGIQAFKVRGPLDWSSSQSEKMC